MANFESKLTLDAKPFLEAMRAVLTSVGGDAKKIDEALSKIKVDVDTDGFKKGLDKAEDIASKSGKEAGEAFKENVNKGADGAGEGIVAKLKGSLSGGGLGDALVGGLVGGGVAGLVSSAAGLITEGLSAAIEIGQEFETGMQSLSAVTGVTGEGLDDLGNRARGLALKFGGEASTQLGAFQTILSKFGPDLAKTPEALSAVSENVNILAKAAGLDAKGAVDALSNSMLQFGVDASDPAKLAEESGRFINVLAASAKVGAAEIPQVAEAVLQAGVAAKGANISFEETNAAIQVLAVGGKVGSEAGISLRNVLGLLQKQSGEGEKALNKVGLSVKDLGETLTTKGIGAALEQLSGGINKLGSDAEKNAFKATLFGSENASAVGILLDGTKNLKDFTAGVTGTTEATSQAATNMNTFGERISRIKAVVEDKLLGAFQAVAPVINGFIDAIMTGFNIISEVVGPIFAELSTNIGRYFGNIMTVVKPILAIIGGVIIANLVNALTIAGVALNTIYDIASRVFEGIFRAVEPLIAAFKKAFGFEDTVGKGIDFIKLFQDALKVMSTILSEVGGVVAEVGGFVVELLLTPIQYLVGAVTEVVNWFGSFNTAQKEVTKEAKEGVPILEQIKTVFANIKGTIGGLTEAFHVLKEVIGEFFVKLRSLDIAGAIASFTDIGSKLGNAYNEGFNRAAKKTFDANGVEVDTKAAEEKAAADAAAAEVTTKAEDKKAEKKKSALQLAQNELKLAKEQADTQQALFERQLKQQALLEGRTVSKDEEVQLLQNKQKLYEELIPKAKELLGLETDANGVVTSTKIKITADDGEAKAVISALNKQFADIQEQPLNIQLDILKRSGSTPEDIAKDIKNNIKEIKSAVDVAVKDFGTGDITKQVFDEVTTGGVGALQENLKRVNALLESAGVARSAELTSLFKKLKDDIEKEIQGVDDATQKAILSSQIATNKQKLAENKAVLDELLKDEEANREQILALLTENVSLETNIKLASIKGEGDARIKETEKILRAAELQIQGIEQKYKDKRTGFVAVGEDIATAITAGLTSGDFGGIIESIGAAVITDAPAIAEDLASIIKDSFTVDPVSKAAEEALKKQTDDLQKQLAQRELTYQEYIAKLDELDQGRVEKTSIFAQAIEKINAGLTAKLTKAAQKDNADTLEKVKKQIDATGDVFGALEDNLGGFAKSAAEQFGAVLTSGGNALDGLAQIGLQMVKQLVAQLIPAIFANYLAFIPPPFNVVAAAGAVALVEGFLSSLGAESGVVGIGTSYTKKKGATDTIPLWVAPGETILNAKATADNRDLLEFLNAGGKSLEWYDKNVQKFGTVIIQAPQNDSRAVVNELQAMRAEMSQLKATTSGLGNRISSNSSVDVAVTLDRGLLAADTRKAQLRKMQ